MRIDDLQRPSATQGAEKTDLAASKRASNPGAAGAAGADIADVSELAQSLSIKDPQKIERLRLAVQSGTYSVPAAEVAQAIIDAHTVDKT
jgi:anti-sigma28 factor (negative regulator of flagellin synthesis)